MKKFVAILALFLASGLMLPAHAGNTPNVFGFVYSNTTTPGDGFVATPAQREGKADCRSIFGIVALGDCSVKRAMRQGGISQLSHYDIQRRNILGFQTITIRAYGR